MSTSSFKTLIKHWQDHRKNRQQRTEYPLTLYRDDLIKLQALADTFGLELNDVSASLIHQAIREMEEKMPYIPGPEIIRMEEGEAIHEDCGPMPDYIAAQKTIKDSSSRLTKNNKIQPTKTNK
ncbi:MAG: hypothetical protein OIF57_09745 [Marinobacterium sp.]|nr:hypothetical protein [Marinobacterium sp.]